jgi:hypothetical protein
MAILTALFTFLGKQLSTVLRAILGWSVSALFGRLSNTRATILSGLLVASLFWPVLLLGVFFPAVSAWVFALLPLQKWFGAGVVRTGSVVLALVLPMIIGLVVHSVAPASTKKRNLLVTVLGGYPLTIGFAAACLITAVLVPAAKVVSMIHGWDDAHVYVQAKKGRYAAVLDELVKACAAAGVPVAIEPMPRSMDAATRVLKIFARGTLSPLMTEDAKRLKGKDIEVYLYPADLLLRGKATLVARIRARMMETKIDREAFLVAEAHAQVIQNAMGRIAESLESASASGKNAVHERAQLQRVRRTLDEEALPFDEWVLLDRNLRKLEENVGAQGYPLAGAAERPTPDTRLPASFQS